jgi:hypothetical protein
MSVILATWEADKEKIVIQGQYGREIHKTHLNQ